MPESEREEGRKIGRKGSEAHEHEEKSKGGMTVEEAGHRGGERTSETHGHEFYRDIGQKGGSKGGAVRAQQHEDTPEAEGKMSLEEAGRKGGEKVRRLVKEGEEHQNE